MHARDETILFSAVAVLLAAMTLAGLAQFALADTRAAANERQVRIARYAACTATTTAPAARTEAGRNS